MAQGAGCERCKGGPPRTMLVGIGMLQQNCRGEDASGHTEIYG